MKRMSNAEQIVVTDQVGKRHVVLRYVEVETDPDAPPAKRTEVDEYRLSGGRSVKRTGDDTFETADGVLSLKVLEP